MTSPPPLSTPPCSFCGLRVHAGLTEDDVRRIVREELARAIPGPLREETDGA